jgi:hypothetical protein
MRCSTVVPTGRKNSAPVKNAGLMRHLSVHLELYGVIRLQLEFIYRFLLHWLRRIHGLVSSTFAAEQLVLFLHHLVAASLCLCVANAPRLPCYALHKHSDISLPAPSRHPIRDAGLCLINSLLTIVRSAVPGLKVGLIATHWYVYFCLSCINRCI